MGKMTDTQNKRQKRHQKCRSSTHCSWGTCRSDSRFPQLVVSINYNRSMPEDLKLSQIGSSQLPPPFRGLHSPGVRKHLCLLFPEIVYSQHSECRSCVQVEVAVLGSPSLIVRTVSVDVKQHWTCTSQSSGAVCRSRWPSPGSPSLISLMVSVDVKQHERTRPGQSSGAVCRSRWPSRAPRP